jgi:uncharacterized protein YlxW (UPF0749 family)
VLLALEVNTQRAMRDGAPSGRRPDSWYQEQLRDRDRKLRNLERQNQELTQRVGAFEATAGRAGKAESLMKQEVETLRARAGLTPLKGTGRRVTLHDNKKVIKVGDETIASVVHDEDLLRLANDLFNAGADGVAVNGIRLAAGWDIRCAGNTIMVSGQRVSAPCRVEAIAADPKLLEGALVMPGGIIDDLRNTMQLKVTVRTLAEVRLPAGTVAPLQAAKPDRESTRSQ